MSRRLLVALVLAAAGLMVWSASAVAATRFATPSRNIGCIGGPQELRCDIGETEGKAPKKPRSCRFDWGNAFVLTPKAQRGRGLCASDTVLASPGENVRILKYGQRISFGRPAMVCVSRKTGLTCTNGGGHGFELSRQRIRLF